MKKPRKNGSGILQESEELKDEWEAEAWERVPPGTRVTVMSSDLDEYVGQHGVVVGFDKGPTGSWPMVRVRLDSGVTDGFYCDGYSDDEIAKKNPRKNPGMDRSLQVTVDHVARDDTWIVGTVEYPVDEDDWSDPVEGPLDASVHGTKRAAVNSAKRAARSNVEDGTYAFADVFVEGDLEVTYRPSMRRGRAFAWRS